MSPTVLKNLRYFIRPLYFSRTGWRAQRLVKNLPQQTTPFRNPADRTFTFSLSLSSQDQTFHPFEKLIGKIRIVFS